MFSAMDCQFCEMCVLRSGQQVGNVNISYLCQNCQQQAPNSFVLRKAGKNYLVLFDKLEELVSIEISKGNVTNQILQFNLLDNLKPKEGQETKVGLVKNQLERAFVEYCFNSSKLPGNHKIIRVEKVYNRAVQLRFLNELEIVHQNNKQKPLSQLIRILFHGTRTTSPYQIALSENGLSL